MNIVPRPKMHSKKTLQIKIHKMHINRINEKLQRELDKVDIRLTKSLSDAKKQYFK